MSSKRVHRSLKVQFEKGVSRTETLLGREYYVVPCIAMVEGVRFGANQDSPELGLAQDFGQLPIAWANRPLVLNHPQDDEGNYVSANIPSVLEQYQFGITMNPELKKDKLHLEAWIDVDRVTELGDEFEATLQRIKDEEDVEVSVGFFSDIVPQKGKFKGQAYGAVWKNIKPDHLAVLSEGILGACSVKDGCGIPRLNKGATMATPKIDKLPFNTKPTVQGDCGCGGHESNPSVQEETEDDEAPVTQGAFRKFMESLKSLTMTEEERLTEARKPIRAQNHQILAQTIDTSLMDNDIRKILSQEGSKKFPKYSYLYGYTQNVAVFEHYDDKDRTYKLFQIQFNIQGSKVEFVGEAEEVILQTKIVPVDKVKLTTEQENDMTTPTTTTTTPTAQTTPPNTQEQKPVVQTETPLTTTESQAPVVQTAQQYIESAPQEVREVLQASMKVHTERKDAAIKALKEHPANKFSEDYLKAQTLEVLENMTALLPGTYKGVAPAAAPRFNSSETQSNFVDAPKVFSFPAPGAAKTENAA